MTVESIRWCETHNLPYSTVRTDDDRMVCWWIWWTEAMDRWSKLKDEAANLSSRKSSPQTACRPVDRVVMPTHRPLYVLLPSKVPVPVEQNCPLDGVVHDRCLEQVWPKVES